MGMYGEPIRNSDEIIDDLFKLDFLCKQRGLIADLLLLGGASLALMLEMQDKAFRSTRDIDVNILNSSDDKAMYAILQKAGIDIVGGVMTLPPMEDFQEEESKHQLDADFEAIRVFVPTPELLACSKIFTGREKDLQDLEESSLLDLCDIDKLLEMVQEYKSYMSNPNDKNQNVFELSDILQRKGLY